MSIENPFQNTAPEDQIRTQENPVGTKEKPEIKEEKDGQNTDEKDREIKLDNKDTIKNKEDEMFGFSKEYLRKLFNDLSPLDSLRKAKNIEQHEVEELLNYLMIEVFPYFKLTLEDEEKYKKEIENNPALDDNIKRINIESFKQTRTYLLKTFLEFSVIGIEKRKGIDLGQKIEPLLKLKKCLLAIQSRLKETYRTSDLLDLPKVLNKILENYEKRNFEISESIKSAIKTLEENRDLYNQLVMALKEEVFDLDNLEFLEKFKNKQNELKYLVSCIAELLNYNIIYGSANNPLEYKSVVANKNKDEDPISLVEKVRESEEYRKKYMRKFEPEIVFNLLKQHAEHVRKDKMYCTNRDFKGTKNIFKEGALLSTKELLRKFGYSSFNLKGNAARYQEVYFGFPIETPLIYGNLIGGRQILEKNEWEMGGLPKYGNVFFLVNIDKVKNRAFCVPGSRGTEDPSRQFSIDHAYLIKAVINIKKALSKEFWFDEDAYLEMNIVGHLDLQDVESINFYLGGEKSENIEQLKNEIEDLKKQYPQFQDKIRIID